MSAIFGILCFDDAAVERRDLDRMGAAMRHRGPDSCNAESLGSVGLGSCLLRVNREDLFEAQPLFDDAASLALVADCRIDNREALAESFGWPPESLREIPDSAFILEAYKHWGEAAPDRLLGDFAFALWNGETRTLFLARDPMGQRYLHYHHGDGLFAFATDLVGLWPLHQIPQTLRQDAIGRTLFGDAELQRGITFYDGVSALAGGSCLAVHPERLAQPRTYWTPHAAPEHCERDEDYYLETYRAVLGEAVRCRVARLLLPPALCLSGGVDSSAIAAVAGPVLVERRMRLFGLASVAKVSGAPKDARSAVESCTQAMPHVEPRFFVRTDESVLDDLERNFAELGIPATTNYVFRGLAKVARECGARLLMDGHGGDYTLNFRGPLDWSGWPVRRKMRELWTASWAAARADDRWRWGTLLGHIVPRWLPAPVLDALSLVRRGFAPLWTRFPINRVYARALLRAGVVRAQNIRGSYRLRGANRTWMLRVLEKQRCGTSVVPATICGTMGIEFTRPFHDRRVVELALGLPESLYFRNGRYRHLARCALAGLVPREILEAKSPNGAFEPDYRSMRSQLLAQAVVDARRLEQDAYLRERIDFARVKKILDRSRRRADEPASATAHALQAITVARFLKWHERRNHGLVAVESTSHEP